MHLPTESLARIRQAYDQGLFLQGYAIGVAHGPWREWEGAEAGLLAGRLVSHLGGSHLALAQFMRLGRRHPDHLEVQCHRVHAVLEWRGPLAAWELLQDRDGLHDPDPAVRSHWQSIHALVLGTLRDFDAAEQRLARAFAEAPDDPWLRTCRAHLYGMEDRYEDALAAARAALDRHPGYMPAVQATAHTLVLLDRAEEARALLAEAAQRIESNLVAAHLFTIEMEMARYASASQSLDRVVELSPIMENTLASWIAARRSDVAFLLGDRKTAREFAARAGHPFYDALAARLGDAAADGRRVVLPVPFVRQHHSTCCPATLAALGRYWSKPTDHLGVAEEICYDGTAAHSERLWAERNGWRAREFTVTWEAATALLDRAAPFALGTLSAHRGHMQAVTGYDTLRGTLLIRDPSDPSLVETWAEGLFRDQRVTGPRGLALVPEACGARIDDLDLPESALYDRTHALQAALFAHDRARARAIYDVLAAEAPDHRLTLLARRSLAAYDGDPAALLACHARLITMFPGNAWLELGRLECMRALSRREERLAVLEALCADPDMHPIFWTLHANELAADSREHPRAVRLLRRTLRSGLLDGATMASLASVSWVQGRHEYALALYRFAACLEDKNEDLATSYFRAAHHLHQAEVALAFLESRVQRLERLSGQATRTCFEALCVMGRRSDAFAMLEKTLAARPNDAELKLFATDVHARHGNFARAEQLLSSATGHARTAAWLRAAAALAEYRGDPRAALDLWKRVLDIEPLAIDAHAAVARRLAEVEGHAAAVEHLREAARRFPFNLPLHQLLYSCVREHDHAGAEQVLRGIVTAHPVNAWARRELALRLGEQGGFAEAFAELSIAEGLEPYHPAGRNVHGQLCLWDGRPGEAREAWRQAIRLEVDNRPAIGGLLAACASAGERADALALLRDELGRQMTDGSGVLAYLEASRGALTARERLAALRRLLEERPELWQAWSAVVGLLLETSHRGRALVLAQKEVERHPLVPQAWIDLGRVRGEIEDHAGAVEALERAVAIDPQQAEAVRLLVVGHMKLGRPAQAREVLEAAAGRTPLEALYPGLLGRVLWAVDDQEGALASFGRAVRLKPGDSDAWKILAAHAREAGRPRLPAEIARDLTSRQAGETACWMALARALDEPGDLPERLAALEEAIRLQPRGIEAHDLKAELLADAGRLEEARAACQPAAFGDRVPTPLRGRRAWVEAVAGHLPDAITRMKSVVREEPTYYWGWTQLAEWYRRSNRGLELLATAGRMVELSPLDPSSYGYLGFAKQMTRDVDGAQAAWARALELAPDYLQVSRGLFQLQLEEWETDQAEQTLERYLRPHAPPEVVRICELHLAASPERKAHKDAVTAMTALCLSKVDDLASFTEAASIMIRAGWRYELDETIRATLADKSVNPNVAVLSVRLSADARRWRTCIQFLRSLDPQSEAALRAAAAYCSALSRAREGFRLRRHLEEWAAVLRRTDAVWAGVGTDLLEAGLHEHAVQWLSDWPQRRDLRPGMLLSLVRGLQLTRREGEALRVIDAALAMPPDPSRSWHLAWKALGLALAGDHQGAGLCAKDLPEERMPPYYAFILRLTRALLRVQQQPAAARRAAFAAAQVDLESARARFRNWTRYPELRRAERRVTALLATLAGGMVATLWGTWRRLAG